MNGEASIIYFCAVPRYVRFKMTDCWYDSSIAVSFTYVDLTVEVGKHYSSNSHAMYKYQISYFTNGASPESYEYNGFVIANSFQVTNTSHPNFNVIQLKCDNTESGFILGSKSSFRLPTPSGNVEFIY